MKKIILCGSLLFLVTSVSAQKSVKLIAPKTVNELNTIIKKQPIKKSSKRILKNYDIKKFDTVEELEAYKLSNPSKTRTRRKTTTKNVISHPKTTRDF